jgi:hypothetical protein
MQNTVFLLMLSILASCTAPKVGTMPVYSVSDLISISNQGVTQGAINDFGDRNGYLTFPGRELPEGWAIVNGVLSTSELSGMSFGDVTRSKSIVIRPSQSELRPHVQQRALIVRFLNNEINRIWYNSVDFRNPYVAIRIRAFIKNDRSPCGVIGDNEIDDRYFCIGPLDRAEVIK